MPNIRENGDGGLPPVPPPPRLRDPHLILWDSVHDSILPHQVLDVQGHTGLKIFKGSDNSRIHPFCFRKLQRPVNFCADTGTRDATPVLIIAPWVVHGGVYSEKQGYFSDLWLNRIGLPIQVVIIRGVRGPPTL